MQPLNLDLLESYPNVDERLQDAPWHTVDTDGDGTMEHYGAPFEWGSNVLMYSEEVFGNKAPTSWDVVFEEQTLPDGEPTPGGSRPTTARSTSPTRRLYLMAHNPELGIEDPYALDREQFEAALELLRQQRELVGRYWHDAYHPDRGLHER